MGLSDISADAVLKAIAEYDRVGRETFLAKYGSGPSRRYLLRHEGRLYDSKAILGAAHGHQFPDQGPLRSADFSGGLATVVKHLSSLGFEVVSDESDGSQATLRSLGQPLKGVLEEFPRARVQPFGTRPELWAAFENFRAALEQDPSLVSRPHLKVKWSPGAGNWARVPWISILDTRVTTSTQGGIYIVYLLREDMTGAYLTLNQGVTEPRREMGGAQGRAWLRKNAHAIRERVPPSSLPGFRLDDSIDLRTESGLGSDYEVSTIAHKFYPTDQIPDDADLRSDLDAIVRVYEEVISDTISEGNVLEGDSLLSIVDSFSRGLQAAHVSFGTRHDELVRSFVASLATKGFVILTGLSGSGKTQLAIKFGQWLGAQRWHLEPVRPDWTGTEAVLGFVDALQPAIDGRQAWHVPDVLRFLLRAAEDEAHPYLLILDEMNLAHVERYFADVLSGMESATEVLPNLVQGTDGQWRTREGSRPELRLPMNLLFVGTVNVDETTYAFSPKVLDRANVFEFRVETGDLELSYEKPADLAGAADSLVAQFLAIATDDNWQLDHPAAELSEFAERLRQVHAILSVFGYEFGHRVFYEALRFASMLDAAGDPSSLRALDFQVMQKVLPRLHGSRRQLEPPLCALAHYCFDLTVEELVEPTAPQFDPTVQLDGDPLLPLSFDKLRRMTQKVRANQFTSFTD
jgi:5-methylcytosine-specific restriction protein B